MRYGQDGEPASNRGGQGEGGDPGLNFQQMTGNPLHLP